MGALNPIPYPPFGEVYNLPEPIPNVFLLEILFAAVFIVSLVLAVKYLSFGRKWVFVLFIVGVVEILFSLNYYLINGFIIGLVTAVSGVIIPLFYWAKHHFRKKDIRLFFIVSSCLEMAVALLGFLAFSSYFQYQSTLIWVVLLTLGFYSLAVGIASGFLTKQKR